MKEIFGSRIVHVSGTATTPSNAKAKVKGTGSGTSTTATTYSVVSKPTSATTVTDARSVITSIGDRSCYNQLLPLPTTVSVSRLGGNHKNTPAPLDHGDSSTSVGIGEYADCKNRIDTNTFCFPLEEDSEDCADVHSNSSCDPYGEAWEDNEDNSCSAVLVLNREFEEMENSSSTTGTSEPIANVTSNESVEKKRISVLTETIASKQSDIAIEFCAMIKRIATMMEDVEKEILKSKRTKSSARALICKELHQQAIQMANKQVRLAHQSTNFVVLLEQEMDDAKSAYSQLLWIKSQQEKHSLAEKLRLQPVVAVSVVVTPSRQENPKSTFDTPKPKLVDSDDDNNNNNNDLVQYDCTESTTTFCIQEISFGNPIVVDVNGVTEEEALSYCTKTSNLSNTIRSNEEDEAQLRLLL
jgi:hypothetical protein